MPDLSQLRLQFLGLIEEMANAAMHLREAESFEDPRKRDASLEAASDSIAELSADLAVVDAALQRHLNP